MIYLRQSTASQEVLLGPFLDDTDGKTAETGLTIANTDIKLWVAGATTLASKNSGGGTHISNGNYYAVLDATDTATVGSGAIVVQVSGALAVRHAFTVLEEVVFDALFAASAPGYLQPTTAGRTLDVSATGEAGLDLANVSALPAGAIPHLGIVDNGTAQSASSTTLVLRSAAAFADDALIGATILITGGTLGVGQTALITDYVGSTDTATLSAWSGAVTPTGTITYVIFGTAPSSGGGSGLDAAATRAALGLASANLDTQLAAIQSDTDNIQTRIPAALVSGRIDASVGAMAANVMTAAAAAADLTTELQSGLATASALTTVAGYIDTEVASILAAVDTEVAAIKAKTDSLTFTVANVLDANIQRINDVAVTGDGSSGDKFGV